MEILDAIEALRQQALGQYRQVQATKAADWAKVKDMAPDHARLIGELSAGFGKLAYVRVTVGHDVVLDSDRYADG